MTWAPTEVEGLSDCPCGAHPVLALRLIDGKGWLAVLLLAQEAVSLDCPAEPTSSAAGHFQAAVGVGGPASVRVRLGRGPRGGLLGLVKIDHDGAELGICVGASEAVALAICRRIAVEVPGELVRQERPPWIERRVGTAAMSSPGTPSGPPSVPRAFVGR